MSIQWKKIREESSATPAFKENLRATLYEYSIRQERAEFEEYVEKVPKIHSELQLSLSKKTYSFRNFITDFSTFVHSFKRWIAIVGGSAVAMMVMIPFLSIFTSPPLSASSKSYINSFSGKTEIIRTQEDITPHDQQEVFVGDQIKTQSGAFAEILFFEGTSLRLDQNTIIEISDLNPQEGIFSAGGIKFHLVEGRIWVQNFHAPSTNSAVLITTAHAKIFPVRANLDIEHKGGKENIRVFENSALVQLEGLIIEEEISLEENQEIFFTPFDESVEIHNFVEKTSLWKTKNLNRSKEYKKEYLTQISTQMKEEFVADEISAQIHTFIAQDPSPEEMENMISQVNGFFIPTHSPEISEEINTETTAEKSEPIKKQSKVSPKKRYTSYKSSKKYTPKKVVPISRKEENKDDIIQSLETKEISGNGESEEKIKTAKEIIKEQKTQKFQKAAQNFSEQVNTFHLKNSRKQHALNILNKIPNTPENLELLKMIEKNAPTDVQRYIVQKQAKIRRTTQ